MLNETLIYKWPYKLWAYKSVRIIQQNITVAKLLQMRRVALVIRHCRRKINIRTNINNEVIIPIEANIRITMSILRYPIFSMGRFLLMKSKSSILIVISLKYSVLFMTISEMKSSNLVSMQVLSNFLSRECLCLQLTYAFYWVTDVFKECLSMYSLNLLRICLTIIYLTSL